MVEATEVAEDWSRKENIVAPIQKVMETEGVGSIVTKKEYFKGETRGKISLWGKQG